MSVTAFLAKYFTKTPVPSSGASSSSSSGISSLGHSSVPISLNGRILSLQKPEARPNTHIPYEVYTTHKTPMFQGPLNASAWKELLSEYPDQSVVDAVVGIIRYGARIGYEGVRAGVQVYANHRSADSQPDFLERDLLDQLSHQRLNEHGRRGNLPKFFVSCPIGLRDKSNGKKRRIHDLSFPSGKSVNDHINQDWGTVRHPSLEQVLGIVASMGEGCVMLKRDFEDAYRHVPVSPIDSPLLGFSWRDKFYSERFLPFGLRMSGYLFNLFAELFHWILELRLQPFGAQVVHYVDDFLIILPPGTDWKSADRVYMDLASQLGLNVKLAKNEQGLLVAYGGIEIDSGKMEARLTQNKQEKGIRLVKECMGQETTSLTELRSLTGFLSFTSTVVPLGRTFTRRLFDLQKELDVPRARDARRPVSADAKSDLVWWCDLLTSVPAVRSLARVRPEAMVWSDGSGATGLGGYYRPFDQKVADMTVSQVLAVSSPNKSEDIAVNEIQAIVQCLRRWGKGWQHHRVVVNVANRLVARGIENETIRGEAMEVLRECLLLAARLDIDLRTRWVSRADNHLAEALSSYNQKRIKELCPKIKLKRRGKMLTY